MGANIRLRSLGDYIHHGGNVLVECRACAHRGVLDARKLQRWYYCHRWSEQIEVLGQHLYCRECRGRAGRIRPTLDKPDRPNWMSLESDWARLVKRLRG